MKIQLDCLSMSSIDAAIQALQEYSGSLEAKAHELCEMLANIGYEDVWATLAEHVYSGETISNLQVQELGPAKFAVLDGSVALLFLEFGAGVNGYGHPKAGEFGMGPGTYPGQTHALDPGGWWFPTDDQNLVIRTDKDGQGWGHSRGNPPYMPFYNASQRIRADLLKCAQEVFRT